MRLKIMFGLLMFMMYICSMSNATTSQIKTLYGQIPKEAYRHIAEKMEWESPEYLPTVLSGNVSISEFRFQMIKDALDSWNRSGAFSKVSYTECFDPEQHRMYFKALTDFINGEEYMLISAAQRMSIVSEQKSIGNQIQQQSKAFL